MSRSRSTVFWCTFMSTSVSAVFLSATSASHIFSPSTDPDVPIPHETFRALSRWLAFLRRARDSLPASLFRSSFSFDSYSSFIASLNASMSAFFALMTAAADASAGTFSRGRITFSLSTSKGTSPRVKAP